MYEYGRFRINSGWLEKKGDKYFKYLQIKNNKEQKKILVKIRSWKSCWVSFQNAMKSW